MVQKEAAAAIARNKKLLTNNKWLTGAELFSIRSGIDGRSHRLPDSLAELLRTGRVAPADLPRLLHEVQPSLGRSDYWPVMHNRGLEWFGACFGLGSLGFFLWMAAIIPRGALDTNVIMVLGLGIIATAAILPITLAIAWHWRNRRRAQMASILDSHTRHAQTPPERGAQAPIKPAPHSAPIPVVHPPRQPLPKLPADRSELKSTSPDGRYQIRVHPWEARMSQWVETPQLIDTLDNKTLFHPDDDNWSLVTATWQSESIVVMRLRRYPGDHKPGTFEASFDCASRTASVNGAPVGSFNQAERVLNDAYTFGKRD